MKKINLILSFIGLSFLFILSACSSGSKNTKDNETPNYGLADKVHVENTYTNVFLENDSIVETVESVYDSVVAIDSYLNNNLYGSGSGVLIGKSTDLNLSFLVTCHHVIESCDSFKVTLSDESVFNAYLVGGDAESDIAVLSIEGTEYTYASWFLDTDTLKLGSGVICIGNPLGTLPGSVSTGIVSYNNRKVKVDDYHTMNLIQTDVAINSGNSGGALFNTSGALIGIVNAKYSSSGIEGLGFAIPANQAKSIVDSIVSTALYDTVEKSWETGYVSGRWNLGFTLGYSHGGFTRTIGIASAADNETSSDYNFLFANDRISAITLTYKDTSKPSVSLSNITAQTTSVEMIYAFIYSAELSLGDTLMFDIMRNGESIKVSFELKQYRYYI